MDLCPHGLVSTWNCVHMYLSPHGHGSTGTWVHPHGLVNIWTGVRMDLCPHGLVSTWTGVRMDLYPHGLVSAWMLSRWRRPDGLAGRAAGRGPLAPNLSWLCFVAVPLSQCHTWPGSLPLMPRHEINHRN